MVCISLKAWRPCLITGSSKESVSFEKNRPLGAADLEGHGKMSCRNLCSSRDQKSNNMVLEKSHSIKNQVQERDSDGLSSLASNQLLQSLLLADSTIMPSPGPVSQLDDAGVVKLQKVSKSYKTQRSLTYCGGVLEELWWKVLDFALLKNSSVSFFNDHKQEAAISKWARAKTRAAMVGKGLSKHDHAQKLDLRYWLEAIDPHHRYGRNLLLYYDVWFKCESSQPFFYWLEIGDGKEVNLDKCPRTKLQQQRIKYLGLKGREAYEVIVKGGKLVYRQSGELLETSGDSKWIFVLSTSATLYVGRKRVGCFQHSSFLAGAATIYAGRLVAHAGFLEAIWPYSGHYLPTEENFKEFISFLEDNNVDITKVKVFFMTG